jgi:hypothetical protein
VTAWKTRAPPNLFLIIGCGLICRISFIGCEPYFSDDLYRYIWEGWLVLQGENPFLLAANSPILLQGIQEKVNHPELTSIYPPVALWAFAGISTLSTTIEAFQIFAIIADLITVTLVWYAAKSWSLPPWCGVLYALHPLPVVEGALGAHLEIFALPAVVAAALFASSTKLWWSPFFVIIGAGIKVFPILILPSLLKTPNLKSYVTTLLGATLLLSSAAFFIEAGDGFLSSWTTYSNDWQFNALALPLATKVFGSNARGVLIIIGALCVVILSLRRSSFSKTWFGLALTFLLLSPTVHPWYALWLLVPSILTMRLRWAMACSCFTNAYIVLAYLDPETGAWTEPTWLPLVSWVPAAVIVFAPIHGKTEPSNREDEANNLSPSPTQA